MKTTNSRFAFPLLSILLITLSIFTSNAAAAVPSPVRDMQGKILRSGIFYYILPAGDGSGGGLTQGAGHNGTICPLDVVQEQADYGLPVTFTPVNPKKGVIRVSTDHNFKFTSRPYRVCVESNVWRLDNFDESTGQSFVTTGGVEGNPGRETLSNWFKIEKYDDYYKLAFCPNVCGVAEMCKVLCKDIGVYVDRNGTRRLALSDVPFKVMFKKI